MFEKSPIGKQLKFHMFVAFGDQYPSTFQCCGQIFVSTSLALLMTLPLTVGEQARVFSKRLQSSVSTISVLTTKRQNMKNWRLASRRVISCGFLTSSISLCLSTTLFLVQKP